MTTKEIDMKISTYYLYNDLINIKNVDPNMLKLDKNTVLSVFSVFIILVMLQKKQKMVLIAQTLSI